MLLEVGVALRHCSLPLFGNYALSHQPPMNYESVGKYFGLYLISLALSSVKWYLLEKDADFLSTILVGSLLQNPFQVRQK